MRLADDRDRREEVGDDGRAPEAHLAPRQRVAEEAGRHHQQVDDDAEDPEHFARRLVGAVVEAARHVDVDSEEEHRRADGVHVADQPAVVHVAADAFDGRERHLRRSANSAWQHDAREDLHAQHEHQDAAERPHVVEVARRREVDELAVHHARDRQALVHPFGGARLRLIGRNRGRTWSVLPQPIRILVSDTNS